MATETVAHLPRTLHRVVDRVVQFRKPLDEAVERPRQVGDSLGSRSASERPMAADSSA